MKTLTELGRHQICKMIGIRNPNSIFIKSKEAFLDRMELYRSVYNIDKLIDTYKEEIAKYPSEEEYIKKLIEDEENLYDIIERELVKAEAIDVILGSGHITDELCTTDEYKTFIRDETNECTLRIYFDSPLYEAFKFAVFGLYECNDTLYNFIYELTNNKFLALISDLDINMFKSELTKNSLIAQTNLISKIVLNLICPKHLNNKNVKYVKGAEVQFSSTVNKNIESLDKIVKDIRSSDGCTFENIELELFTTEALAKNNKIALKKLISTTVCLDRLNITNYDEYSLIRYLRKIREEPNSKYDNYLSNGDIEMKVTQDMKIAWI